MTTQLRRQTDPLADRHLLVRPIRVIRRMKRRNRWVLRLVLAAPFLGLVSGVVLTRTAVTRWLVLPQMERALNMKISADAVYVSVDGKLVIERAVFRLPHVDGPAANFLKVARIEARIDWLDSVNQGSQAIRGVRMTQPVVIVSHSLDDNTLNIGKLSLPKSSGTMALPTITATDAGIELAEHSGGHTTVLKHIQMDGWLDPAKDNPNAYAFQMTENNPRPRPGTSGGFKLHGTITSDGDLHVAVENFSLDSWPDSSMPRPVRALFKELDLEGEVPRAYFSYGESEGFSARLELRGVGMDVPVQPSELTTIPEGDEAPEVLVGPPPRQLRMHGVSGFVTFARDEVYANVRGMAENLPYAVTLRYRGVTADAPFTCELVSNNYRVDRQPRLLPFAPKVVKERLATFSSPTATVNTRLKVSRGEPAGGEPGAISVSGMVELRDGVAAFEGFPYEFQDIHGVFRFDNSGLEWVNVTGRSASGAELSAKGLIAPLHEDARADIYVSVRNAPIDEAMQNAFGKGRSDILDALFSQKRFDELRGSGLVQSPEEHAAANRELEAARRRGAPPEVLSELERRATIPAFAFRGRTDVDVHVHRPMGDKVQWMTTVDIRLPEAGLLPEKFGLPIVARNVAARVVNRDGELLGGEFVGLTGGRADVRASFKVPFDDDEDQEVRPEIHIDAHEMPLNAMLIQALPGGEEGSGVKRILRALGISGGGRGSVRVRTREHGELGFDADFSLVGAEMRPESGAIAIADVGGRLLASEDHVDLTLSGRARAQGADGEWRSVTGPLNGKIEAEIPASASGEKTRYRADVSLPGVRLDAPVEPLLRVFSPDAAMRWAKLRAEHNPAGQVDLKVNVASGDGVEPRVTVLGTGAGPLDIDAMGGRFSVMPTGGSLRITAGEHESLTLENLAGDAFFEGFPVGRVSLSGSIEGGVAVALRDGLIESVLVEKIASERLDAETWRQLRPRGRFDADLLLARGTGGTLEVRGSVQPRSLTVRAGEQDLSFDRVLGSIDFGGGMGSVRQLALIAPLWSTTIAATWNAISGGIDAHAEFGVRGERLTADLLALLPRDVSELLGDIGLQIAGPFQLKGGSLSVHRGEKQATRFSGVVEVENASLDVGAELERLAGSASISFERAEGAPAAFDIVATADRFEAAGIALNSGFAIVKSGLRDGEILIPEATAQAHGGRVVVDARVMPGENGSADQKRTFFATLSAAGVRLAPLLKDLGDKDASDGVGTDDDRSRGVLEATLSLQGKVGEPNSRRGRGRFQISEGRIVNVPFMMRMVELSNLQLPTNAKMDNASGRFFMDGPLITFEGLGLFSSAVQILGSGTMDWPTRKLDLRFDTRPSRSIPVLSGLVRGIRDGLVTTTVKGTLDEPEIKLQQFPGARRMLGRGAATGTDEPPVETPWHSADAGEGGGAEGIRPTRARRQYE